MIYIENIPIFDANVDQIIKINSSYNRGYILFEIFDTLSTNLITSITKEYSTTIILPKESLLNGRRYMARVTLFEDDIETFIEQSELVSFRCLSTPTFYINPVGTILSSTLPLQIYYKQNDGELIKQYRFSLYSNDNKLISQTDWLYDENLSYSFIGLSEGIYHATAEAVTVNGLTCISNKISATIIALIPNVDYDILGLVNNKCEGYISYKTRIIAVATSQTNLNFNYIDGSLDLRGGKYLYFDRNIHLDDNFSIALFCKDFDDNETLFIAKEKGRDVFKISSYYYPQMDIYKIILTTYSNDTVVSEHFSQDLHNKNVKILVNKINELYRLTVKEEK